MENRFIAKRYLNSKSTAMGQSDSLSAIFDDVIDLSLGDPDMNTPGIIIDKAFADAKAGHTHYTAFRGDPQLRHEIIRYYKEDFNMNVSDDEIFVTASGCLAMYLVLEAVLDEGDEVILQAPYFTPYPQQVVLAGGVPVELPSFEKEDFQWLTIHQTAKAWKEALEQNIASLDKADFFGGMLELTADLTKIPKATGMNLVEFVQRWTAEIPDEQIRRVREILAAKKCTAAVATMDADPQMKKALSAEEDAPEKPCDNPVEKLVREHWVSSKLVRNLQQRIF